MSDNIQYMVHLIDEVASNVLKEKIIREAPFKYAKDINEIDLFYREPVELVKVIPDFFLYRQCKSFNNKACYLVYNKTAGDQGYIEKPEDCSVNSVIYDHKKIKRCNERVLMHILFFNYCQHYSATHAMRTGKIPSYTYTKRPLGLN